MEHRVSEGWQSNTSFIAVENGFFIKHAQDADIWYFDPETTGLQKIQEVDTKLVLRKAGSERILGLDQDYVLEMEFTSELKVVRLIPIPCTPA